MEVKIPSELFVELFRAFWQFCSHLAWGSAVLHQRRYHGKGREDSIVCYTAAVFQHAIAALKKEEERKTKKENKSERKLKRRKKKQGFTAAHQQGRARDEGGKMGIMKARRVSNASATQCQNREREEGREGGRGREIDFKKPRQKES